MVVDWSNPSQKYLEMVRAFVSAAGIKDGSIPVIKRTEHESQWREWYAYYRFRKLRGSMYLMEEKDQKTVPAISPIDFDAEFVPPHFPPPVPKGTDNVPRRSGPIPVERRTAIALARNEHLPILHENVSYEEFKIKSKSGELPVGAKWVASLGIIYGTPG